jgi:LmbE family N-acetylglucosaminyl deacetylase
MRIPRVARGIARQTAAVLPKPLVDTIVRLVGARRGPAIGVPDARHIVVLAPHPDDESIGCGGLLAHASRRGADITVVFATDGDDMLVADAGGDLGSRRREEAIAACTILGARPVFLGFRDGALSGRIDDLGAAFDRAFAETHPDLVVLPWFGDDHRDHAAVNRAFARTGIARNVRVLGCEIWSPLPANRLVDITAVADDKRRAIAAHTADTLLDPDAVLGLNRFRGGATRGVGRYAEAYVDATAGEYIDWVASLTP